MFYCGAWLSLGPWTSPWSVCPSPLPQAPSLGTNSQWENSQFQLMAQAGGGWDSCLGVLLSHRPECELYLISIYSSVPQVLLWPQTLLWVARAAEPLEGLAAPGSVPRTGRDHPR